MTKSPILSAAPKATLESDTIRTPTCPTQRFRHHHPDLVPCSRYFLCMTARFMIGPKANHLDIDAADPEAYVRLAEREVGPPR